MWSRFKARLKVIGYIILCGGVIGASYFLSVFLTIAILLAVGFTVAKLHSAEKNGSADDDARQFIREVYQNKE